MIGNRTCAIIDRALDYLEKEQLHSCRKGSMDKKSYGFWKQ